MLLINTYVAKSSIEGVGVFTVEPIKAGTLIWKLEPSFDRLVSKSFVESAPEHLKVFFVRYAYPHMLDPDLLILEVDNGRFMNHQFDPNTEYSEIESGYAIRDIAAGEELTCNYAEFDPTYELLPSFTSKGHNNGDGRNSVSL